MREARAQALSVLGSALLNGGIFAGMLCLGAGGSAANEVAEPPPFEWIDVTPMARRGAAPPPRLIRHLAPPEPAAAEAASLSRDEVEAKPPVKKARQPRPKPERASKRAEAPKRRDPRADAEEDLPPRSGQPSGSVYGLATHGARSPQARYVGQVSFVLSRQFEVPSSIAPSDLEDLQARIHFRVNPRGQLEGAPELISSSGDPRFDKAALRAIKRFRAGGRLKIPLPPEPRLRRAVLSGGITATMQAP